MAPDKNNASSYFLLVTLYETTPGTPSFIYFCFCLFFTLKSAATYKLELLCFISELTSSCITGIPMRNMLSNFRIALPSCTSHTEQTCSVKLCKLGILLYRVNTKHKLNYRGFVLFLQCDIKQTRQLTTTFLLQHTNVSQSGTHAVLQKQNLENHGAWQLFTTPFT